MPDFRVKVGFFSHPKTEKLRRHLGLEGVFAWMRLWEFCTTSRPDGSLAGMDDEDIEIAAHWDGPEGQLVEELAERGLIDGGRGAYSLHDWAEHQEHVAGQCDRSATARANALARWHKAGKHDGAPHEGCPLCKHEPAAEVPETIGPAEDDAAHDAAHCAGNAPTNQPTNQPTNHAPHAGAPKKRAARPAAYSLGGEEVWPASLVEVVKGWPGWTTRHWSAKWKPRADKAADAAPIMVSELTKLRRTIEAEKARDGLAPNIGLLVSRLESARCTGRRRALPVQLPLPRAPESQPPWTECGEAARQLLSSLFGEQPLAVPA
jgi:hypothetical protein